MLFPEEFINKVREENDIVDVVSNYVPLKKGGANYKGLCPFHSEKTPSFTVSPAKQIFHCFGCGEGGNVFHFLMKQENMAFPDAVRALAERCGRALPETKPSPDEVMRRKGKARIYEINEAAETFFRSAKEKNKAVLSYLEKRQLSKEAIDVFRIGYAPDSWDDLHLHLNGLGFDERDIEQAGLVLQKKKGGGYYNRFRNRIIFPIVDIYARVLGFGGRVLDESTPKYLNSPETPVFDKGSNLYGLNLAFEAIRKQDYAILVEGYMDVIMAFQNGIRNIVATLGTSLTQRHLRRIRRYTRNLALFFDSDEAGLKAAERSFDLCVPEGMKVKVVTLAPGEDPDSFLRKYGKQGFSDRMSQAKPIMDFMIEQVMGEEPPSGLEEKVALAERLAPLLSVIPNAIEQELYVKKTASLLGVEARNLMVNFPSTVAKKRKKRDDLATAGKRPKKVVPVWEGELVGLMMNNPDVIHQIKEEIEPEFFKSSELRACVERLFALPEEGLGSDSIKSLILTEDTALAGLLAKYTIEGKKPMDVQGLTDRLRLEHLKDMQRKLQAEIEVAETEGRIQKDNRLVKKKALLSQEVEALKQKLSSEGRNVTE